MNKLGFFTSLGGGSNYLGREGCGFVFRARWLGVVFSKIAAKDFMVSC